MWHKQGQVGSGCTSALCFGDAALRLWQRSRGKVISRYLDMILSQTGWKQLINIAEMHWHNGAGIMNIALCHLCWVVCHRERRVKFFNSASCLPPQYAPRPDLHRAMCAVATTYAKTEHSSFEAKGHDRCH